MEDCSTVSFRSVNIGDSGGPGGVANGPAPNIHPIFVWSLVVLLGIFNLIDIYTTYQGVVLAGAYELNPWMRWVMEQFEPLGALIVAKSLSMLGVVGLTGFLLSVPHPKLRRGTMITLFVVDYVMAFVVLWNTIQLMKI